MLEFVLETKWLQSDWYGDLMWSILWTIDDIIWYWWYWCPEKMTACLPFELIPGLGSTRGQENSPLRSRKEDGCVCRCDLFVSLTSLDAPKGWIEHDFTLVSRKQPKIGPKMDPFCLANGFWFLLPFKWRFVQQDQLQQRFLLDVDGSSQHGFRVFWRLNFLLCFKL